MNSNRDSRHGPALVVHGGAWEIPEAMHQDSISGCREAARIGWELLEGGGSALDAVEAAVCTLENDPAFDAGFGSVLNRAGEIELDAIIMEGRNLNLGAVLGVKHVLNPVRLARLVMTECNHTILVSQGAEAFAREHGLSRIRNSDLVVDREKERWHAHCSSGKDDSEPVADAPGDTVGAVARDSEGRLAVATSTGGTFFKHPGRVGDSPLVGCGAYADDRCGAASATGEGEELMKVVISKSVCNLLYRGMSAQEAADAGIALLARRAGGQGGLIVLDQEGRVGVAHNTPYMAYAYITHGKTAGGIQV